LRATANRDRSRGVPHRQWRESRKPLFSGLIFIFGWNRKYRRIARHESNLVRRRFFEDRRKRSSMTARCEWQAARLAPRRQPCAKKLEEALPNLGRISRLAPHQRLDVPVSSFKDSLEKPQAEFPES
jgi:hypothetical protein